MYVTVHVGMCIFADESDSTDLRIVKKNKKLKAASKEECENASAITV